MKNNGPLSGLLVLDLTRVLVGPYCTMILSDLGARVIKVEAPEVGDDSRNFGPFIEDQSAYFMSLNRNKESIALNLKNDKDIDNFQRIRQKRKNIFKEIISYKDLYNEREKDSLIATKNEIFLCMEKLNGLKLHSTPVSLRRYCLIFIYLSPFLFNTKLITEGQFEMSLGIDLPVSILFSITISFILMALYNIQDYIENPFDQKGLDDLLIDQMQIFKKESLYE